MLKLIKPTMEWQDQIVTYREAFQQASDRMDGTSWLAEAPSIEAWLVKLEGYEQRDESKSGLVPGLQYIAIDEKNHLVGMVNLRLALNDYLSNYGGHVGYSILPEARRQGHGTELLRQTLKLAKEQGLTQVLVTTNETNIGSQKIIESNGGVLEDKRQDPEDGQLTRRYWITLV